MSLSIVDVQSASGRVASRRAAAFAVNRWPI
jgi:hypothetical protein